VQVLALLLLGAAGLLPVFFGSAPLVMGVLWGAAWSFQETAYVTLAMRFSVGAWAATFFAICMIFSNLGTSLGEALGGLLVPHLGFDGTFMVLALIAWFSLVFVRPMMARPNPSR
jgi:predicted MFS family arabinose efflux permease